MPRQTTAVPDHVDLTLQIPEMQNAPRDGKMPSRFMDPCAKAAKQSMECLERNGHDKSQCQYEFLVYRRCKQNRTKLQRKGQ